VARARVALCVLVAAVASTLAAAPAASAADVVVLVSGFTSSNPFTTSAPECEGTEGEAWTTVAPTLKAAGLTVFTAPGGPGATPPAPCSGGGPLPPVDAFIDTQGDLDTNGRALARFVAFLRDAYGVTSVQFVGHSDGGLWSRSAIAQAGAYAGVRVLSLDTVASPHTGSFVADAAMLAQSIDCVVPDRRTAQACRSLTSATRLISSLGGPTAIAELTYTYMVTWTASQPFGGCPVTVLDGTPFAVPGPVSQVPRYYTRPTAWWAKPAPLFSRRAARREGSSPPPGSGA
jgi:triacylglycerol lipase